MHNIINYANEMKKMSLNFYTYLVIKSTNQLYPI